MSSANITSTTPAIRWRISGCRSYARYRELFGEQVEFPEGGYPGDYVKEIAAEVKHQHGDKYLARGPKEAAVTFFRQLWRRFFARTPSAASCAILASRFDSFFSEKAMRERGEVTQSMARLRDRGLLYSQDGAEWFRSTQFGDDKDRTVIKSDGELTYFAADIAYHRNKFERKFAKLINVWGADHHGYVPRLKAAMQGLGLRRPCFAGGAGPNGPAHPRRRTGAHG